jgi:hypothetical protein
MIVQLWRVLAKNIRLHTSQPAKIRGHGFFSPVFHIS